MVARSGNGNSQFTEQVWWRLFLGLSPGHCLLSVGVESVRKGLLWLKRLHSSILCKCLSLSNIGLRTLVQAVVLFFPLFSCDGGICPLEAQVRPVVCFRTYRISNNNQKVVTFNLSYQATSVLYQWPRNKYLGCFFQITEPLKSSSSFVSVKQSVQHVPVRSSDSKGHHSAFTNILIVRGSMKQSERW